MSAVSQEILTVIKELQALPSLAQFALGGGTNLALQYSHRVSDDIDLFCSDIIGKAGFAEIEKEVKELYGKRAQRFDDPCDIDDQFSFLRFFVHTDDGNVIKVEILQNMKNLYDVEVSEGIRILSKKDIGLFKLISAANRSSQKDIYDLDFITNEIPLLDLYLALETKSAKFNKPQDRNIFDLDEHATPLNNPELLLKFDSIPASAKLPAHSHDRIHIMEGSKSWAVSKIDWRTKMRALYLYLGKEFPGPKGIDIS
jgi:hypothetical protein